VWFVKVKIKGKSKGNKWKGRKKLPLSGLSQTKSINLVQCKVKNAKGDQQRHTSARVAFQTSREDQPRSRHHKTFFQRNKRREAKFFLGENKGRIIYVFLPG